MNSHRAAAHSAERYFPVRIRVARDRLGRERQYDDMVGWLHQHLGHGRYWFVRDQVVQAPECWLFYFTALGDAQAFVHRFTCGVWVAGEWADARARD